MKGILSQRLIVAKLQRYARIKHKTTIDQLPVSHKIAISILLPEFDFKQSYICLLLGLHRSSVYRYQQQGYFMLKHQKQFQDIHDELYRYIIYNIRYNR